ncbi:MAG TPA: hypothetical protein VLG47_01820 [Candidatus Saccharimonadales bacterium]|nr:hypothetical protein [Candidatus Saccharimonadales bacterium]
MSEQGGEIIDGEPSFMRIIQFVDAVFHSERASRIGAPPLHNFHPTTYNARRFGALFVAAILAYTDDPLFPDNSEFNGTLNPNLWVSSQTIFGHLDPFRNSNGSLPDSAVTEINRITLQPDPHLTIGRILVDGLEARKFRMAVIAREALLSIQLTLGQGQQLEA